MTEEELVEAIEALLVQLATSPFFWEHKEQEVQAVGVNLLRAKDAAVNLLRAKDVRLSIP